MISVIVPIYNTQDYLERCIQSIQKQTYADLEILLINDGSTDHSLDICQKYAQEDARIVVVDQANKGLSGARNAGLDVATGTYVAFVDSDDFVEENAYQCLRDTLVQTDADIAQMNFLVVSDEKIVASQKPFAYTLLKAEEILKRLCERKLSESVCDKLYKREAIQHKRFCEDRLNEDYLFHAELLMQKPLKMAVTNYAGYHYFVRQGSIARCGFGKAIQDAVYNNEWLQQKAQTNHKQWVAYFGANGLYQARTAILIMTQEQFHAQSAFVAHCRRLMTKNLKYSFGSFLAMKDILFCLFFVIAPNPTKKLMDLVRKTGRT